MTIIAMSGGIIFTTIQKFAPGEDGDANPVLTDRRNVIVIADEAHSSQSGQISSKLKAVLTAEEVAEVEAGAERPPRPGEPALRTPRDLARLSRAPP